VPPLQPPAGGVDSGPSEAEQAERRSRRRRRRRRRPGDRPEGREFRDHADGGVRQDVEAAHAVSTPAERVDAEARDAGDREPPSES
jgi:hypothetical protein